MCLLELVLSAGRSVSRFFLKSPDFFTSVSRFSVFWGWEVCLLTNDGVVYDCFFVDTSLWNNFIFWHQEKNQDLDIENSYSIFFLWRLLISAVFAAQVFFWKLPNPFRKNDSSSAYIKSLGYPPKAFTCTFSPFPSPLISNVRAGGQPFPPLSRVCSTLI